MSLRVAVPLVSVAALAVPVLNPSPPVDVVPVLASTPFGAGPGQRVTHTITLSASGTGTASAVRVTFTTTVDLDAVTATASTGRCTGSPRTVVCDLGDLRFPDAGATTVTVAGTVHSPTGPGALVENKVTVQVGGAAATDRVVSNAYLVPGPHPSTIAGSSDVTRAATTARRSAWPSALAALVAAAVVVGGALLFQRFRRRRS